jgi:tetratricopeptide (TPR) repeat protein
LFTRFEDEQNLSLFTNPCHLIKRGIEFAKQNKNEEAIRHFERAIALDEEMSFMAHYNLAIALLYNFNCVKADEQRRMLEEAQSHLAKSKELINSHILKRWNMIKEYAISMGSGGTTAAAVTDAASDLQRQMDTKIELLNHVINSAEEAIIRLIEVPIGRMQG